MKSKKGFFLLPTLTILLAVSLFFNLYRGDSLWFLHFPNANTRDTYESVHHVKEAQQMATGKGIKVGIIGTYFGYNENRDLFAGGENFTENKRDFKDIGEHGLWMAVTLKEIAPDVEIYALNARNNNPETEAEAIIKAIQWAIDNDIDILTYSAAPFGEEYRDEIDSIVKKAVKNGIVTTFIHYGLEENILPNILSTESGYSREPDLNIYHYDYNLIRLDMYKQYREMDKSGMKLHDDPYLSYSSMSPVLAGFIAMMKEVNNTLTPSDYKRILKETSKEVNYRGSVIKTVVDAPAAVEYMKQL